MIKIYNESCFDTMNDMPIGQIDIVLTSPFYNTNDKAGKTRTLLNTKDDGSFPYVRYDQHIDSMSNQEYAEFTVRLFDEFDRILNIGGCVLYNLSYSNTNTECMFYTMNQVIEKTNFTIADIIVWKKKSAMPNNCSSNRLTRIWEFVFVLCRSSEQKTFNCAKRVTSIRGNGQKMYENIYNIVEAKNNDGSCPFNKATFSTELVGKLLDIYATKGCNTWVYDPFMGSGTTAVECKSRGMNCIGSEISKNQCEWAEKRLGDVQHV